MGAIGLPLLGLVGTGLAAGGAAYVTKKVIDGANSKAVSEAQSEMSPKIEAAISQQAQQRALVEQQNALVSQKMQAYANEQVSHKRARGRLGLMPGVFTSNQGATLGATGNSNLLGN